MEEYKYLGCMVNDQLNCARMVEERAKTLSDWMRRCRVAVGELIRGKMFVKLYMLVDSVLLYIMGQKPGQVTGYWEWEGCTPKCPFCLS